MPGKRKATASPKGGKGSAQKASKTTAPQKKRKLQTSPIEVHLNLVEDTVQIRNLLDEDLDLEGWGVKSITGEQSFAFDSVIVPPGEAVTLWSGHHSDKKCTSPLDIHWTNRYVWNNDGDACVVTNKDGVQVAMVDKREGAAENAAKASATATKPSPPNAGPFFGNIEVEDLKSFVNAEMEKVPKTKDESDSDDSDDDEVSGSLPQGLQALDRWFGIATSSVMFTADSGLLILKSFTDSFTEWTSKSLTKKQVHGLFQILRKVVAYLAVHKTGLKAMSLDEEETSHALDQACLTLLQLALVHGCKKWEGHSAADESADIDRLLEIVNFYDPSGAVFCHALHSLNSPLGAGTLHKEVARRVCIALSNKGVQTHKSVGHSATEYIQYLMVVKGMASLGLTPKCIQKLKRPLQSVPLILPRSILRADGPVFDKIRAGLRKKGTRFGNSHLATYLLNECSDKDYLALIKTFSEDEGPAMDEDFFEDIEGVGADDHGLEYVEEEKKTAKGQGMEVGYEDCHEFTW